MPSSEMISWRAWCRSGSTYIQGDLGAVKVESTGDGGVYLGASSQYAGSIGSVEVGMTGSGNVVLATSNGNTPLRDASLPAVLHSAC